MLDLKVRIQSVLGKVEKSLPKALKKTPLYTEKYQFLQSNCKVMLPLPQFVHDEVQRQSGSVANQDLSQLF